jgi:hypothetical protein
MAYTVRDFHTHQQTVADCDAAGGKVRLGEAGHAGHDVHGFYSRFAGELIVSIVASSHGT